MKFKNFFYLALLVVLFVEILIVFPRLLEESRIEEVQLKEKKSKISKNGAEQTMQGVHLVESQQGRRDWELFAEKAEGSSESSAWNLRKIKIIFYSEEQAQFTVIGDEGSLEGERRNVRIRGNVQTSSSNGYVFNTESLEYQAKARHLVSPGAVKMKAPSDSSGAGMAMTGTSMLISVDKKTMDIAGPVKSNRSLADGKKVDVEAGRAVFSSINNEAQFFGNVVMQYDQMKLVGPEASFLYNQATSALKTIELKGGVNVSDVEKTASAQNVVLDVLQQKYSFKGSPKVQQGEDELQGDEIVFLDGGKKVKVERVRARMENK